MSHTRLRENIIVQGKILTIDTLSELLEAQDQSSVKTSQFAVEFYI